MEAQDEQRYGSAIPDVTAALLDFARLSQRVGSAVSDESGLIAKKFLERLLTLFVAQKGAVLLTTQYLNGSKSPAMSSLSTEAVSSFRPGGYQRGGGDDAPGAFFSGGCRHSDPARRVRLANLQVVGDRFHDKRA